MADVFGFDTKVGEGFIESEEAVLIGSSSPLHLIQDWNVAYNMSVNPVYECGTSTVYWSVKHASGNLTVNRIVASNYEDIKQTLGWVCEPETVVIKAFTGQCDNVTPVNLTLLGDILTGVTYSGNSQQAYVGENLTAQFVGLEIG